MLAEISVINKWQEELSFLQGSIPGVSSSDYFIPKALLSSVQIVDGLAAIVLTEAVRSMTSSQRDEHHLSACSTEWRNGLVSLSASIFNCVTLGVPLFIWTHIDIDRTDRQPEEQETNLFSFIFKEVLLHAAREWRMGF